ncbi:ABC transporter permease [Marinagarivorans algicola]|uniref:ABC transporter permease n=1 Tax=Marinagarivorans algicola TaxID=1513270 RepID=UPI0006B41468|nr:FtsX-like permease family protein [Marinagarivorans algicola]
MSTHNTSASPCHPDISGPTLAMQGLRTLSFRLLWRGAGGRSAVMLMLSLVVAVAVVATLTLTTDRLQALIYSKASHFLAADARVTGTLPIPVQWLSTLKAQGITTATSTGFRAMLFSGQGPAQKMQLGAVKAVSANYPLKGELLVANAPFGQGLPQAQGPAVGEVWLTSRLFAALNIALGDVVSIGDADFTVSKALIQEPDSPQSVFGFAPRALIHQDDVAKTNAINIGSRVNYSLMLAGQLAALKQAEQALQSELGDHFKWQAAGEGEGPDAGAFKRITNYVLLVGALALVLGAVAIALAADEFAKNQYKTIALLKTLGIGPRVLIRIFSWQLLGLLTVGCLAGLLFGWLLHLGLLQLLVELLPAALPAPELIAFVIPLVGGAVVLLAFAGPRFWALRKALPVVVIKSQGVTTQPPHWWVGGLFITALVALLTQQIALTVLAGAGLLGAFFAVRLFVLALFKPLTQLHSTLSGAARLGLGQWLNYRHQNATQASVFGLIFMVLFSVYSARTHLLEAWRQQVPAGAPNHFIFNIYDHQKNEVAQFIEQKANNLSEFYPMSRGRITGVNDITWEQQLEQSPNTQRMNYERELNLTWSQVLQDDNEITAGQWWQGEQNAQSPLLISIEQDYAEGANLHVGDHVTLSLAGQSVEAVIANTRSLNWQSMRPNFFIIFNKKPAPFVASNWITSFYLPSAQKTMINDLMQRYPSITLVEVDQALATVKSLIDQLGLAVEYLLVLMILAAAMVLAASLLVTLPLRMRTASLQRAFGAPNTLIRRALWCEFLILGAIAGVVACVGAELLVRFWLAGALQLTELGMLSVWYWGVPLAMAILGGAGMLATRRVLTVAPVQLLKATS